jgi:hypothetical protein
MSFQARRTSRYDRLAQRAGLVSLKAQPIAIVKRISRYSRLRRAFNGRIARRRPIRWRPIRRRSRLLPPTWFSRSTWP